jgi:1A family penicillin-binding protein
MGRKVGKGRAGRLKRLVSFAIAAVGTCAVAAVLFLLFLRTQALPAAAVMQTSYIYDVHGEVIDAFNAGENRQVVPLEAISPWLIQAVLAIEDHRFYDHFGVDPIGILRSAAANLKAWKKVQGASTITQQLARNLYLTHERTWERKIREAIYAIQLEMRYGKDDILEQYLNQIYYGHSTYGVQAAARLFFGKDAADLTLAESALLAGVPKGPRYYSPYYDEENARARQRLVLDAMVRHGYISQRQADEAMAEPLAFMPLKRNEPSRAPFFTDYVKQLAQRELGISEQMLRQGGLRIHTTLDLRMQEAAERAVAAHLDAEDDLQAALVAIDPRTGHIKAMVGGVDYARNQFNRALATTRQPGSSFKPIVYLAALESGRFSPVTRYKSEPTLFTYDEGRRTYMPSNFNDKYAHDFIDMRMAIARSDNIYAVNTLLDVGGDTVINTARKLGITAKLDNLPSLALGSFPVSPLEMASAFGAFANQGVLAKSAAILRVEDMKGRILYEHRHAQSRAVDASYAYVLTSLLESVFEPGGTAHRVADRIHRPVAGKTGTTNSDAWMVGYTPELSVAVWVGRDKGGGLSSVESHKAAPVFADFLETALEPVPPKIFPVPDGIVSLYIDPATGLIATDACPESRLEVFVRGTEPVEFCNEHVGGELEEAPFNGFGEDLHETEKEKSWWEQFKRWWGL